MRNRAKQAAGVAFIMALVTHVGAFAQQPPSANPPQLHQRETAAPPAPPTTSSTEPPLSGWQQQHLTLFATDFGQLARYAQDDAAQAPPAAGENRVIFFGDSITDFWKLGQYFPGKEYINRGIGGQTTSQMLVRFREDVLDLQPKVLVILAGTNDIAGNTGPISLADIEKNFTTFAELARLHGIRVVFSSVTPVNNYTERAKPLFDQRPAAEILQLNEWMKDYCVANGAVYLDYFDALVDNQGMLKRNLSEDGLHPNDAGYKIMAPLAEAAVEKALGR